MKQGSIVRYNPKWCTEEERHLLFVILEERGSPVDDTKKRFLIRCLTPISKNSIFYHIECVDEEMIEEVTI